MLLAAKTALQPIPIRLPQLRQSYAKHPNPEILRMPLVASLVEGHREVAHYLLAHGADPSLVSELDDLTPLQAARKHGHEEFVALFLRLGVWAVEGVEAKIGPSEDSFCRFRRPISGYWVRKRRKIDRCGQFAADVSSAAQAP